MLKKKKKSKVDSTAEEQQRQEQEVKRNSAQEWTLIKDIKDGVVHLTDGGLIKALKVTPISISLLSEREQMQIVNKLARQIDGLIFDFQQASTYKNVDMTIQIKNIEEQIKGTNDIFRKKILRQKLKHATEISMLDSYKEVLYFIVVSEPKSDAKAVAQIKEKTRKLAKAFTSVKIKTLEMSDRELEDMWHVYNKKTNIIYDNKSDKKKGMISFTRSAEMTELLESDDSIEITDNDTVEGETA